jgi:RNA polymerase sigma-70 factor (ECF subfamily)
MSHNPPETRASLIIRLPNPADVVAWDELMAVYGPIVYRLALRRGLQAADADDLVQEVFGAIAKSVAKWLEREDRGKFRAWLLRIARNTTVNFLTRPAHRSLGVGGDDAARALAELPIPQSRLSSDFDLEYRREVFQWAAEQVRNSVAESTWQAFCLTHIDAVSVTNAAKQLGISVGTVYVARSRVMSRLQELVKTFEVPE